MIQLWRATVVAVAVLLVMSALVYGSMENRDDVIAVTVAEVLVVGALVALVRFWRLGRTPA